MQSNRIMLLISVLAGIIAMATAFLYLRSASGALTKDQAEPPVSILVTRSDLNADHILDSSQDLAEQKVPSRTFAFLARAAVKADERAALRGRRINTALPAGSPLLYSHLVGIATLDMPADARAMTIRVDDTGTIGGILVPGDRVDLLVSWRLAAEKQESSPIAFDMNNPQAAITAALEKAMEGAQAPEEVGAAQVLSNVRVLAVGDRLNRSREQFSFGEGAAKQKSEKASTITVEVTPEEALKLIKATAGGRNKVTVLLRATPKATPATGESVLE
ncbi:MAG: Flp pilus assembly protein CpaB [Planctomycetota bacterium]|nr:Flp pilus assembly protein CpaB [Planctomycetota bacterium]